MSNEAPEISVVVPVYNEAPNLEQLYAELIAALEPFGRSFEIVAVDDGSKDGSFEILKRLHARDPRLRVVRFLRNFGQNPALYAGFNAARGRIVATIDADLQNPPSEIPKLVAKLDEGYDMVQGWRENRQDSPLRLAASRGVNAVVRWLTKTEIRDRTTAIKAYRREVVERLCAATHRARYVPAETAWLGVSVGEVPVAHRHRTAGESKYGLWSLLRVNFDMIASISTAPVRLITLLGVASGAAGFLMALRVLYVRLVHGNDLQLNSVLAAFFIMGGIQLFSMSILCEYISRIYQDVQQRPYYIVRETLD